MLWLQVPTKKRYVLVPCVQFRIHGMIKYNIFSYVTYKIQNQIYFLFTVMH